MASGTIKDKFNCYTTAWLNPIFSNQIQVPLGTLSQITNGVITDVAQLKGASQLSNGFIQFYINGQSGDAQVYAYFVTGQPITTSAYKMKISFFY